MYRTREVGSDKFILSCSCQVATLDLNIVMKGCVFYSPLMVSVKYYMCWHHFIVPEVGRLQIPVVLYWNGNKTWQMFTLWKKWIPMCFPLLCENIKVSSMRKEKTFFFFVFFFFFFFFYKKAVKLVLSITTLSFCTCIYDWPEQRNLVCVMDRDTLTHRITQNNWYIYLWQSQRQLHWDHVIKCVLAMDLY